MFCLFKNAPLQLTLPELQEKLDLSAETLAALREFKADDPAKLRKLNYQVWKLYSGATDGDRLWGMFMRPRVC